MLEILTYISPVNLLASPNIEIKDNALLSIGIVHEMSRIFYFLGVKLEAIDKIVSIFLTLQYSYFNIFLHLQLVILF